MEVLEMYGVGIGLVGIDVAVLARVPELSTCK